MSIFSLFIIALIGIVIFSLGMCTWATIQHYRSTKNEQNICVAELEEKRKNGSSIQLTLKC